MEENEALEIYCRRMITQVNNQLNPETAGERGWRERQEERGEEGERTALRGRGRKGLQSEMWRRMIIQIHRKQNTETTAASERQKEKTVRRQRECEDLAGEPVPIQLISALKMKTFTEEMRRVRQTLYLGIVTVYQFWWVYPGLVSLYLSRISLCLCVN